MVCQVFWSRQMNILCDSCDPIIFPLALTRLRILVMSENLSWKDIFKLTLYWCVQQTSWGSEKYEMFPEHLYSGAWLLHPTTYKRKCVSDSGGMGRRLLLLLLLLLHKWMSSVALMISLSFLAKTPNHSFERLIVLTLSHQECHFWLDRSLCAKQTLLSLSWNDPYVCNNHKQRLKQSASQRILLYISSWS